MSDPEDPSQWQAEDVITRGYKHDPEFVKLIEGTKPVDELSTASTPSWSPAVKPDVHLRDCRQLSPQVRRVL